MEQLESHWTYFVKVDVWVFFEKYTQEIQVSFQCDENNVYSTWKPVYIYDSISLNSF
jgi:hypothetical protein